MSIHANEYQPNTRDPTRKVVTDRVKIKFNNIQDCISVTVCQYNSASALVNLIGIHITAYTISLGEIAQALRDLTNAVGGLNGGYIDIILVGSYNEKYAGTTLLEQLKKLNPNGIYVYNVSLYFNVNRVNTGGANIDVKIENGGNSPRIYVRKCKTILNSLQNGAILKDKYNTALGNLAITQAKIASGRTAYANDRDAKPWVQLVTPTFCLIRNIGFFNRVSYKRK